MVMWKQLDQGLRINNTATGQHAKVIFKLMNVYQIHISLVCVVLFPLIIGPYWFFYIKRYQSVLISKASYIVTHKR